MSKNRDFRELKERSRQVVKEGLAGRATISELAKGTELTIEEVRRMYVADLDARGVPHVVAEQLPGGIAFTCPGCGFHCRTETRRSARELSELIGEPLEDEKPLGIGVNCPRCGVYVKALPNW